MVTNALRITKTATEKSISNFFVRRTKSQCHVYIRIPVLEWSLNISTANASTKEVLDAGVPTFPTNPVSTLAETVCEHYKNQPGQPNHTN